MFFVNSYVKAKFLTHDPERIARYERDPLISRPISVNILLGLYEAAERVVADASAITLPVQLLISGADWVVHHEPQHRFFDGSAARSRRPRAARLLPRHAGREGPRRRRSAMRANSSSRAVRRSAATRRPARRAPDAAPRATSRDALAAPLPALSPRGALLGASRAPSLRVGGLLSRGVKLGHQTGFDSGSTLDYVYRNEARGAGPIGRAIDTAYLDCDRLARHPAAQDPCRGAARARRWSACAQHRAAGAPDGHRRRPWPLRARRGAGQRRSRPDSILLRDYSDINVRDGRALIAEKGLEDVAQFVQADAFDR